MECGKKLGPIEGYRHPTMGKDHLLCGSCFDTVSESVQKWSKAVLPYVNFLNNKSSTSHDTQSFGGSISKNIKKTQDKINNAWLRKTNQNNTEAVSFIN